VELRLNFDFLLVIAIMLTIAISGGIFAGMGSTIGVAIILFAVFLLLMWLIPLKRLWTHLLWTVIFGLTIWSYGFNNIPFVRPIPLVDAVIFLVVVLGFRYWWAFTGTAIVRKLLIPLLFLLIVIFGRLIVDVPEFGLLAGRDALFAFELWVIFPAIALGYMLGEHKLNQKLFLLFCVAMVWYLLYPWRELIESISPVVGIQRPVPLFAYHGWIYKRSDVFLVSILSKSYGEHHWIIGCFVNSSDGTISWGIFSNFTWKPCYNSIAVG